MMARSTGRVGSMWKPPGAQHSPAASSFSQSSNLLGGIGLPEEELRSR